MSVHPIFAVIPARGGSKGLPSKNILPLGGIPLIAHSIRFARMCPAITQTIVSTDSEQIAAIAREYGADVPFLRPAELAQDDTPMWPVLQHALSFMEKQNSLRCGSVLLLSPTSPARLPEDLANAITQLQDDPEAKGVVAVSKPAFNPRWVCVDKLDNGYMRKSFSDETNYTRRQDVPEIYRINGSLYLWRRNHVAESDAPYYFQTPHRLLEVPESRAIDIDSARDLRLAELMLKEGMIELPWL